MKRSHEAGLRWLRQADHDLTVAQTHQERGNYSDACFMAEQASQKALKAFLVAQGRRSVPIHSVAHLAERCSQIDGDFATHIVTGRILDQYYIPTRYPDALAPPAVPFESYTREQGEKAVVAARAILDLVARKLGLGTASTDG
ncbi:MAG: HEPN domain-containing protein [Acidobacteria bacterium]|nr:HEPN domain-containing protein [Acidobacteriota bacterium]